MMFARRGVLRGACALAGAAWISRHVPALAAPALGSPRPFTADMVLARARALAAEPYAPSVEPDLPALFALDYDAYRQIRYRPEEALWTGLDIDYRAQFFHLGFNYRTPVAINEVVDGQAWPVACAPSLFTFEGAAAGLAPEAAISPEDGGGFAGFRLHHPVNRPDVLDEVIAFLGASYFRAVGAGQHYGKSARGLAIDTALAHGEEFPAFREFWLERPRPGRATAVVHALLDSPGATGAYTFRIDPGTVTEVTVEATVFARRDIAQLGWAPITSMYLHGENDRGGFDDFRPEVHDSDGLQILTGGGEWLWRPLANPARVRTSWFHDAAVQGFGLMQRDRDFASYRDLEARYSRRPSLWVEPLEGWGPGTVMLAELPADTETADNVVVQWIPDETLAAGQARRIAYRLHWMGESVFGPDLATVRHTLTGAGGIPGGLMKPASRKFVVEFEGGQLGALPAGAPVAAMVTLSAGDLDGPVVQQNPETGGWRVFFDVVPEGKGPTELRCTLALDDTVLSETWVYQWTA